MKVRGSCSLRPAGVGQGRGRVQGGDNQGGMCVRRRDGGTDEMENMCEVQQRVDDAGEKHPSRRCREPQE